LKGKGRSNPDASFVTDTEQWLCIQTVHSSKNQRQYD